MIDNTFYKDIFKRLELFGITTKYIDTKISEDIYDDNFDLCCYEPYDYPICESIEDLLDFCIEYKVKTIYVEPVRFDYEYFCHSVEEDYSEFELEECFNQEMVRLRKAFEKVDEDKMQRLLQSKIEEYIKSVDSRLSTLKPKDGIIIEYNLKAYYQNKCMKYDIGEATAFIDDYEPFATHLARHMEMLVIAMEMVQYNSY